MTSPLGGAPVSDDTGAGGPSDLEELHGRIAEHMATVAAALHGLEEVRAELRRHISQAEDCEGAD